MKQYVLDEPMGAAPLPVGPQPMSGRHPGWWRWLALAVVLETLALAVLYVALNGVPGTSAAAPSPGVAYVASFSFPREAEIAHAPAPAKEVPASRIRLDRGRYLVELHDESAAGALAMLAEATKAHVAGTGIFNGSALRLTRSLVATSSRDAWQAVFGDVANFAIACAGSACDVRFVSLVNPGTSTPASPQGAMSPNPSAPIPAMAVPAPAPVDQPVLRTNDGVPIDN